MKIISKPESRDTPDKDWWIGLPAECDNCGTIVEFELADDLKTSVYYNIGSFKRMYKVSAICPTCDLYLSQSYIKSEEVR